MADDKPHLPMVHQLRAAGVSESYAHEIAKGVRRPSRKLALRLYRETGLKLGPIANATSQEISVLERLEARAA